MNKIKLKLFGFKIFDEVPLVDIKLNESIIDSNVEISDTGNELIYNVENLQSCNNVEIIVTNKIFENFYRSHVGKFGLVDIESLKEDSYDFFVFLLSLEISYDDGFTWIDMTPCLSKNNPQGMGLKKNKKFAWDISMLKIFGNEITEDHFDEYAKMNIIPFCGNGVSHNLVSLSEPVMGKHHAQFISLDEPILFPKNTNYIIPNGRTAKNVAYKKSSIPSLTIVTGTTENEIEFFYNVIEFDEVTTKTKDGKITLRLSDD